MSWFTDPDLFIDKRGNRICHLWRCRVRFGSPLYQHDFTLIGPVADHLSLVGYAVPWHRSSFDALMAYLSEKSLIVNCQGLLIVPSYAIAPNDTPDQNRRSYFWLQDVLNMSRYGLTVPSVPFRAVQYIEGGVAPVGSNPNANEARDLAACINEWEREKAEKQVLEKRVSNLEANNSALKNEMKQVKDDTNALINDRDRERAEKQALEKRVTDLEAKNSILNDELKREKDYKNALINDNDRERTQRQALEKRISDLEAKNSTLKGEVERGQTDKQALEEKVSDLMAKLEESRGGGSKDKEGTWMNNNAVPTSWVPFEELVLKLRRNSPFVITRSGANFNEDNTTNVLATHFSRAIADGDLDYPIKVVSVEDLTPNKEKARFDPHVWGLLNNSGTSHAFRKRN